MKDKNSVQRADEMAKSALGTEDEFTELMEAGGWNCESQEETVICERTSVDVRDPQNLELEARAEDLAVPKEMFNKE